MRSQFRASLRAIALPVPTLAGLLLGLAQPAYANVVGTDAQNFNPTTSGLDFVTVQSSETLKPGIINLGLFLNYAVNSLPYYESNSQGRLNFNDSLLGLDLNAGFGLTDNWDVGVSLPHVLRQSVDDQNGARGEFAQTGGTEVRINTKYRVWGDDSGGVALVASMNFNRIEDNPYVGRNAGPTTNLEVAADTTIRRIALGLNLGYRFRQPGDKIPGSIANPLKNQLIASAAASYLVPQWSTKLITEVYGSAPAESSDSNGDRSLSSAEWLIGAKHDLTQNLALHGGFATELLQGVASPDWRVYTGLNYTFGPVYKPLALPVHRTVTPDSRLLTPVAADDGERFRTQNILFEFDSDKMTGNFKPILDELASHLKSGFRELIVEGHTDSVGAESYNQKLSLRRAEAIRRYLISNYQIDGRRIRAVGFGETKPIADNGNYQGRQANRRVEFVIQR